MSVEVTVPIMPILTLRAITDHLLDQTYVRGQVADVPADRLFFALLETYAPDVPVQMFWPEQFKNPNVTVSFGSQGIPLRRALEDLCAFCGVVLTVTDSGALSVAPPARRVDQMHHASSSKSQSTCANGPQWPTSPRSNKRRYKTVPTESNPTEAQRIATQAAADKAAGVGVIDGQHPIADYTFAHGGSYTGPTQDADDVPLAIGDAVVIVDVQAHHGDVLLDRYFRAYLNQQGVLEWVQDVFPYAQVIVVFPDRTDLDPITLFSQHVRKLASAPEQEEA